jgi:MFS family permease
MGDKSGRKKALYVSVALMAGSTFAMGCLPTYETAGIYATVMLVILRCLQGLSVGGELVGSMIYAVRKSADRTPLFQLSCYTISAVGKTRQAQMHYIATRSG